MDEVPSAHLVGAGIDPVWAAWPSRAMLGHGKSADATVKE